MSNNKTVLEWLEQAKADGYPWSDAAIENCKNNPNYSGDTIEVSLSESILGAFNWEKSTQGFYFWYDVYDDLLKNEL
jgi:hypothetical protein